MRLCSAGSAKTLHSLQGSERVMDGPPRPPPSENVHEAAASSSESHFIIDADKLAQTLCTASYKSWLPAL